MWLKRDIVELGEAGRDLCGYEVIEYGLNWSIAGWQEP